MPDCMLNLVLPVPILFEYYSTIVHVVFSINVPIRWDPLFGLVVSCNRFDSSYSARLLALVLCRVVWWKILIAVLIPVGSCLSGVSFFALSICWVLLVQLLSQGCANPPLFPCCRGPCVLFCFVSFVAWYVLLGWANSIPLPSNVYFFESSRSVIKEVPRCYYAIH